jgi:hypothetical protein
MKGELKMDRYIEKIEEFNDEELRMIAHALGDKEGRMRELAHDENHLNLCAVRQIRLGKKNGRDYAKECGKEWFGVMMKFYKSERKNQYLQDARKYRRLSNRFFEEIENRLDELLDQ